MVKPRTKIGTGSERAYAYDETVKALRDVARRCDSSLPELLEFMTFETSAVSEFRKKKTQR